MPDNQQPSLDLDRRCRKCGKKKPLIHFAPVYSQSTRGKKYRQHTCLDCHRAAHAAQARRLRALNPEVYREACRRTRRKHGPLIRERRRAWNRKLKAEVFKLYGGYRCVCCGETEPSMLTLDHINNDGGEHRRREPAMRWSKHLYAWILKQPKKPPLQVLCYNCNISKFRNNGICAHRIKKGSTTIPQGSRAKRPEKQSTR